jgi:hypothetical protein
VPTVDPTAIQFLGPQVVDVGLPYTVNVKAFLNTVADPAYSANVSLSSAKDPNATIPNPIAITNGIGGFTMTTGTLGSAYLRYDVSGPGVPFGTALAVNVLPAPPAILAKCPFTVTVGVPFTVILSTSGPGVAGNNLGYNADVTVSPVTDPNASIPNPITLTRGSATFTMTAGTASQAGGGEQTYDISAPDVNPGSKFTVQVVPPPESILCTGPATVDAGVPFSVTLNAVVDKSQFTDHNYTADVTLSNPSDPNAAIPNPISIRSGVATFTMSVGAIGSGIQTYTISGPGVPAGSSFQVGVNPVAAPTLTTQPSNATVAQGQDATFWVSATGFPNYQWSFNGSQIPGATSPVYTVHSAGPGDVGSYTVEVSNTSGSLTSDAATLSLSAASGFAPVLFPQPSSYVTATGRTVVLSVGTGPSGTTAAISGSSAKATSKSPAIASLSPRVVSSGVSCQWFLNGVALAGETSPTLVVSDVESWNAGSYTCLVSNTYGSTMSSAGVIKSIATLDPGRLINLSTRSLVGTGANQLIAGFVVGGNGTAGAEVLLTRASGPALSRFGVSGPLADPNLMITGGSGFSDSNSGWGGDPAVGDVASQVGAFDWPDGSSLDSALLNGFAPGAYTAQISGASGDTGIALGEIYDATQSGAYTLSSPRLVNISSRAQVGTGTNVLIAGFVVGGSTSETVLIRASGPALIPFGVPGNLPDPQLQLFRANGDGTSTLIQTNSGWGGDTQIAAVAATVGAFSWGSAASPDSAILVTLQPGAYTAQVSGEGGDTGIALVEVYELP